jgi:hypothetical protein
VRHSDLINQMHLSANSSFQCDCFADGLLKSVLNSDKDPLVFHVNLVQLIISLKVDAADDRWASLVAQKLIRVGECFDLMEPNRDIPFFLRTTYLDLITRLFLEGTDEPLLHFFRVKLLERLVKLLQTYLRSFSERSSGAEGEFVQAILVFCTNLFERTSFLGVTHDLHAAVEASTEHAQRLKSSAEHRTPERTSARDESVHLF